MSDNKREFVSGKIILNSDNPIAKALEMCADNIGLQYLGISKDENCHYEQNFALIDGALNASMYLYVLIQQIYAGDVEFVQKNDSLGKARYVKKLLESIQSEDVSDIQKKLGELLEYEYGKG